MDSDSDSRGRSAGHGRRRHGLDGTVLNAAADDIPDYCTLISINVKSRSLFWQQILTILQTIIDNIVCIVNIIVVYCFVL